MWQNYVFAELVEWMKEFNAKHNFRPEQMVYLFGIDCQQIYRSLRVLYDSLSEIDFNLLCEVCICLSSCELTSKIKATLSFFNGFTSESEYASKTIGQIGSEQIPAILQKLLSDFQWHQFDALKVLLNVIINLIRFRKKHRHPIFLSSSTSSRI